MPKLIVSTQFMENYGSAENPRWKFKGGSEYVVARFSSWNEIANLGQDGLAKLARQKISEFDIEYANSGSSEYVVDWSVEEDDWLSWSEQNQLEFDGKITFPMKDYTATKPETAAA